MRTHAAIAFDPAVTSLVTRLHPVLFGGLVAATLDILAAFAMSWPRVTPTRVLQSIASGLLGRASYAGGARTAALGLALHILIACAAAAVYFVASRRLPVLLRRPLLCGAVYGVLVYLVMNLVVLPLSHVGARWPGWPTVALLVVIHVLCVGMPIATAVAVSDRAVRDRRGRA